MSDQYYLPQETARLLTPDRLQRCKNLGLILDKYPLRIAVDKNEGKSEWLREVESEQQQHVDEELARHTYQRWLDMTRAYHATHFRARLDWRMVVGLGGETILETDLSLHHLYGIPYIPGSALKGLTRAYVTQEEQPSKKEDEDSEEVKDVFGSQQKAGSVIFFDAMPLDGKVAFAVDIMNSHYPNYYGEKKLPTNDQKPNPVTFLTVEHTEFVFALAPRRAQDKRDVELVKRWLQQALKDYGIGGKTGTGYGYFQDPRNLMIDALSSQESTATTMETNRSSAQRNVHNTPQTPAVDPEVKKAEGYIRELTAAKDIASQVPGYYQHWKRLTSQEARLLLAKAIVEKVRTARREKAVAEKPWYKELLAFLDEANSSSL